VTYHRPHELDDALALLASNSVTVLAGGTDIYPATTVDDAWDRDSSGERDILDISRLDACRGIGHAHGRTRIGALTTWTELVESDLPPWFDALRAAAREVGGRQIQNRGTIAGNLCNASPAADGIPPLLILDATVELTSRRGVREVPLADFLLGYRATDCRPDELVTTLYVPDCPHRTLSRFMKLGARRYLVISIVMGAALVVTDEEDRIGEIRIALGACAAVAQRLGRLEDRLRGAPAADAAASITAADLAEISPIDDVRASAEYRRDAALTLVRRLLAKRPGE
jgi:CO/xanthine dehydrogenase FAD-binding subunit